MALLLTLLPRSAHAQPREAPNPALRNEDALSDAASRRRARPVVVTVRGRRELLRHARQDPTAASTVVERDELQAVGQSSADVLARVPGVQVSRTGAQSDLATASIRGADSAQVPVYLAGIRINDDVSGTADLSTVPLWMLDRVEVFRGNAPEYADRLGLGGAIFLWPRKPETTRIGAAAHVGSFGARGGWVAGEVGSRKAGAIVAIRRDQAENDYLFVNDEGRRFDLDEHEERRKNADFVSHDAWAIGRYQISSRARVSTVVNAFDREQGVTGFSVIPADNSRGTVRRFLAGVSAHLPCAPGSDSCAFDLQSSLLVGRLTIADPALELPALRTQLLHNGGERHVHRARMVLDLGEGVQLGPGLSQEFEDVRIERVGGLPRSGNRSTTRAWTTATWRPATPLTLYGLGAIECHTTKGVTEQFNQSVTIDTEPCGILEPSVRVGAGYRLSAAVEALANFGRYVRVPTLAELYGSSALVEGNPALGPETGLTVDAGVRVAASTDDGNASAALDAFLFARQAEDLIRFRRTSLKAAAPYNVAKARILGAEAAAAVEGLRTLRLQTAVTILDPRETTDDPRLDPTRNDVLPLTARLVATTRFEVFTDSGLGFLSQNRANVALVYSHRSSRYDDPAGQTVLPAQNLFDIEATTAHLDGRVVGRLAMRNVFDARQLDLIGLPVPGRSLNAEVEAWW